MSKQFFIFLVGCMLSCSTKKSIERNFRMDLSHIPKVLEYMLKNNLENCCYVDGDCFLLNSDVTINKNSCSYRFWQVVRKKSSLNIEKSIDYNYIESNLNFQERIEKIDSEKIDCIKFFDKKNNHPIGTITFSPLIPYNTENLFECWMLIQGVGKKNEYRFIVENSQNGLVIKSHEYSDFCLWP